MHNVRYKFNKTENIKIKMMQINNRPKFKIWYDLYQS